MNTPLLILVKGAFNSILHNLFYADISCCRYSEIMRNNTKQNMSEQSKYSALFRQEKNGKID